MASSFMTPADSRNSQNLNRVRIFGKDKLSQAVMEEKWDRVKVVLKQLTDLALEKVIAS